MHPNQPLHLDLKKDRGLTVQWSDGTGSYYPIAYLRRFSPSADMVELRKQMASNPLTVLPASAARSSGQPLTVTSAELVGNYAIRIEFSDGHRSAIYSWDYLREIDPARQQPGTDPTPRSDTAGGHANPLGLPPERRSPPPPPPPLPSPET